MQQTEKILATLAKDFPNAKSELNFKNPFQLLVAVILSAQCTDKRVNMVTPALFAEADTPEKMAALPVGRIEELIHSCGFYHSKAKYLHDMSVDVVTRFGGVVPNNIDELRTLAGVGRKTANVVYAVGFGGQAIAVDTHVFRVANRLGLADAPDVLKTEHQLMQNIPQSQWSRAHHWLIYHGRRVCAARKPACESCTLRAWCEYANGNPKGKK